MGTPSPVAPEIVKVGDDRIFNDSKLQASIQRAIEAERLIPEGKVIAAVAYANLDGFRVAVIGRATDSINWTIAADKPWDGKLNVEAAVIWSR